MNHNFTQKLQEYGDKFYLLRVSIGPVQEFIIEARKTRDLHTGSRLLSLATWNSMKPIFDQFGPDFIIYPYLGDSTSCPDSIPNLYMAIVPENKLESTVNQIENSLHSFWNCVNKQIMIKFPASAYLKYWSGQINDNFYMNWVAIQITKEELDNSYKSKLKNIQKFLDERKMTRNFGAWKGNSDVKCVQCGHRERIPYELFSELRSVEKFKTRIKEREWLCEVCLSKRLLNEFDIIGLNKVKFESVSDISARSFKQLIEDNAEKDEINDFLSSVNSLKKVLGEKGSKIENLSGEWFYKEYFSFRFLKNQYGLKDDSKLRKLAEKSHTSLEILEKVYHSLKSKPCKYYTIITMDGDDMGKLMSGDSLDDKDFTIDYQTNLSRILSESGGNISDLINNDGNGYCVYSGGDDLLAFLPLENSLKTINEIRSSFADGFEGLIEEPTLSAGIVILHHHDPLRRGLTEARQSVDNAKKWFRNKDAFFITLRIFSGSIITWSSKWTIDDFTIQIKDGAVKSYLVQVIDDVLNPFVLFMTAEPNKRLSPDFIHDLMSELPSFYEHKTKSKWSFNNKMFKAEFKRLFKRHVPKDSGLGTDSWNDQITMLDFITEVFAYMADPDKNKQMNYEYENQVKENFEHFLKITLFLAREQDRGSDKQ